MSVMRSDRGASAVLIAGSILMIMGFLAIAVDLGFGFNERRVDQTSADAGALGGSLEMVITDQANPVQAAVDEVYSLVNTNLGRTVPQGDWTACTDPNALFWRTLSDSGMLGTTNGSDCISISQDFNTLRVKVPGQETDSVFAVFITDSFTSSAAAEARRNTDWGGGGDFPSGVLDGTAAGTSICIKTGTGSSAHDSCGSPSTGDFGNFKPYFYSAVDGILATMCVSGEQTQPMSRAMADGIDHEFSGWNPVTMNDRVNGRWCQTSGVPGPPFPNMVDSAAGYQNTDITDGLILGGNWPTPFDGRFDRGPYRGLGASILGVDIDNKPLWDFIDDSMDVSMLPACSLARARPSNVTLADYPAAIQETIDCMTEALATTPVPRIFTTDILTSQRIAHSPLYHETALIGNNSCCYHIKALVPIFLDGAWMRSTHATFSCTGEFDPAGGMCVHRAGLTGSMNVNPPGQRKIDSASAIVLDCALMPSGTCPSIQDGSGPLNFLYDLELTR